MAERLPLSGPAADFFFDYVDPASFLMELEIRKLEEEAGLDILRRPFEIRPPPGELVDPGSDAWREYRTDMEAVARKRGVELARPPLVPWSRKAHELAFHAREKGCFPPIHQALFRVHFREGADIGRVDVLVELAMDAGMDRTEAKAVLDVDRHADALQSEREAALERGVRGVPTLLRDGARLEGLHSEGRIRGFLLSESTR